MEFTPLETLGPRIMICGPSNTGKSTLAAAIAGKLGSVAIHLDRFRHLPNTDWKQRSDEEFRNLHDTAIAGDRWVMDGNYSVLMPQRLARATGIILLTDNRWSNLARYFRRTLFQKVRVGNLDGAQDSVKWAMVDWIIVRSPPSQRRYRRDLPKAGLPFIEVRGMRHLQRLYAAWELRR